MSAYLGRTLAHTAVFLPLIPFHMLALLHSFGDLKKKKMLGKGGPRVLSCAMPSRAEPSQALDGEEISQWLEAAAEGGGGRGVEKRSTSG